MKISLNILYGIILLAGTIRNSVTIQSTKVKSDKGYLQKGVIDQMISLACADLLVILPKTEALDFVLWRRRGQT